MRAPSSSRRRLRRVPARRRDIIEETFIEATDEIATGEARQWLVLSAPDGRNAAALADALAAKGHTRYLREFRSREF